ncbi:FtsQ-type POTRA domain-containing protein [Chlorobium sp. BLA1]|uniref:cell division protein FtsQ/DivIB n=1 Tax=Candidatus Chlorobium masyuteum TaxID=2716876 RepID=UPI00141E2FE8|nr:FtsQ-type POTRA domain-containing protein [Candidatus Chlorobium masyuteum]NHQ59643.1 FtsQ-type POTRA domain-containing protein [Candidatus Chlorobium masyuteum]
MPDSEFQQYKGEPVESAPQEYPESGNKGGAFDPQLPAYSGNWKVLLFVMVIVLSALFALAQYASHWKKEVVVREVVIDGLSILSRSELAANLKGYQGKNLQQLDAAEIRKRVVASPYVKDAVISKELNGIVRIRILERVPVAMTVIGGRVMAIDREGYLLPARAGLFGQVPKLLEVRGISRLRTARNGLQQLDIRDSYLLQQFLDALASTDYAPLLVREFHLEENNHSSFVAVQAPTRFIVGNDGNFKEKLKKFEIFWQKVVSIKGFGTFETVDLRFRDRIFTRDPLSPEVPQVNPL